MNHGESTVIETVNAAKPNFKKEELLNAMKYRYATKRFSEKTIPPEDFEVLLETARLAPTSFGLETWKILVIQDKTLTVISQKMISKRWKANGALLTGRGNRRTSSWHI